MPRRQWLFIVVMAFLVVGLMAVQPATPPQHPQDHRQSTAAANQPDRQGQASETLWQRVTSDPVAFTTLCLTGATCVLAVSTIGLLIVTLIAGNRQSRDMKASIRIAEHAMLDVERAFVAIRDISIDTYANKSKILGYGMKINVVNSGRTTARAYSTNISVVVLNKIPEDFRFPDRFASSDARGIVSSGTNTFLLAQIAIQDIIAIFEKKKEGIIYGWLEYNDIFSNSPRHRTEFCLKIETLSDPRTSTIVEGKSSILNVITHGKYNGTDNDCIYRPGETPIAAPDELPDITQPPQVDQTSPI